MDLQSALLEISGMEKALAAVSHAAGILHYDGVTAAPRGSAPGRSDTFAWLAREEHRLFANERVGELLGFLSDNKDSLAAPDAKRIELLKEEYDKLINVPAEEYIEYDVLVNESEDVWRRCKETNDYVSFAPYIDRIVAFSKRFAGYYDSAKDPYDVWLNKFERGGNRAFYDRYFEFIKAELTPLVREIGKCPEPDVSFTTGFFPKDRQRRFSGELMRFLEIDSDRCVLGETEHPFTSGFNYYDCRVTTHYYEDSILPSMYSVIHECGHALYDMNVEKSFHGTVLADGLSMGIHESQSRFYENIIGRSRAFIGYILPVIQKCFDGYGGVSAEMFYRAVNKVKPSLIRIEADELTYSLHILIRYEIEKMLFSGEVTSKELPEVWNRLYSDYLGVSVPNDSVGVMQDVHWSGGSFGYFPSYSIGSAYSAQMLFHMKKTLDVDSLAAKGQILPIFEWLKERVYVFGASKTPAEIIENCCGEPFDPRYYTDYLSGKFRGLYGI